ncbi:PEP/pyruvate-binding domain-containing protein [Vallitalea okinawensis]|uniref:PEP/pyruvate-binding domain-containing protein n=1 Tax=Vallitalea okinawensis TaxID=2078660 RepID=UPI001478590F|nr:PEP/pyruvate-binding domain-containing protein [Vallitalea okinawensis]
MTIYYNSVTQENAKLYYSFETKEDVKISEVGGKARSLIRMTQGGFNVPGGSVLTVKFFEEWLEQITELMTFQSNANNPKAFKEMAVELKEYATALEYSQEQKEVIDEILKDLGMDDRYAVRSSSPEEDLSGASFAGGYETFLGATKDTIYECIKKAFISCMDERVFHYKHQNGFDTSILRIAVIIQKQINSSSSGVGFSLNPLNNCYDEAVINANTGLGESVVSGLVTPDEFIVDKYREEIIEKTLGSKEQAIILSEQEGTKIIAGSQEMYSIDDQKAIRITKLINDIEDYYGFPVDIEWAFSGNELYILQSRPITTYIPLPKEMLTEPGEPKLLYLDGSLTKQGITTPISVMGCDCIDKTQRVMFKNMVGKADVTNAKSGMACTLGGRMYANLSIMIKFQGKEKVIKGARFSDIGSAELIRALDISEYIPKKMPDAMKGTIWGAIKNNIGTVKYIMKAAKDPAQYKAWYQTYEDDFENYLEDIMNKEMKLSDAPTLIFNEFLVLLNKMMAMTFAAEIARNRIEKILKKNFQDHEEKMHLLQRSLPNNITIDMGLMMYDISQFDQVKNLEYHEFEKMLDNHQLEQTLEKKWNEYIKLYGSRTTNELDIATTRPYEDARSIFEQIKRMSFIDQKDSPYEIYNKAKELREKTYVEILEQLGARDRKKLKKHYRNLVALGGKREELKYWYIRSIDAVRQVVMRKSKQLLYEGKINKSEDIFWLKLHEVDEAFHMSKEDVAAIIDEKKPYYRLLAQVNEFPKLIDSRGKILRLPQVEPKEGELVGQPISPGVVVGRVKVLKTPDEKPLLPGEIMVTRATDPGWTPLFINASAILLEVGGLLQHGALVAREYGKPCIAGIDHVMDILKDGQLVEIDGGRGLIKILED